jgi:hypothetical protein
MMVYQDDYDKEMRRALMTKHRTDDDTIDLRHQSAIIELFFYPSANPSLSLDQNLCCNGGVTHMIVKYDELPFAPPSPSS